MRESGGQALQRKQAVEVAHGVLSGAIGIIDGSRRLTGIGHDLLEEFWADPDFSVFGRIDTETDHLPIGRVRELWDPRALVEKDAIIRRIEADARSEVEAACRSLVLRFQDV